MRERSVRQLTLAAVRHFERVGLEGESDEGRFRVQAVGEVWETDSLTRARALAFVISSDTGRKVEVLRYNDAGEWESVSTFEFGGCW